MSHTTSRFAFLSALAAASAGVLAPARIRAQGSLTTVVLGATPSDDMTPIVYGEKSGIFARHGFTVQINRMTSGAAGVAGLLSGNFNFAKGSVTSVLEAHEKNVPLALVAEAVLADPNNVYAGMIVPKDATMDSGKNWNGLLVAIPAIGDIGSLALMNWVDTHGGDSKSMRFIEIPFSAAGAAVEAGRVQAAEVSNPNLAVALASGKVRLISTMSSIANTYCMVGWIVSRDYSTKNPEMVRTFTTAYGESVRYTSAHPAETIAMMTEFTKIKPEIYEHMVRAEAWPAIAPAHVQPVIEVAARYGVIKRPYPAEQIIDANAIRA